MEKKKTRTKNVILCVLLVLFEVGIDELIKFIVKIKLMPISSVTVIPKVLALTYTENTGAAFSIFQSNKWILIGLTTALIVAIVVCLIKGVFKTKIETVSMLMVCSGGIANLIDRVVQGFVVDYIEVLFVRFAIFNFADMLVVVGCFIFAIYSVYTLVRDRKNGNDR